MERTSDRFIRWLLPTLGGLLFLLAFGFALLLRGGSLFAGDGDPGRHIRLGRYMLEQHVIPRVDLFSHTMQGRPFIPYEWLSETIFAAADVWAGLAGVAILTAFLFAAAVSVVYVVIHRSGVSAPLAVAFGLLGLLLQAIHLHPRPHMFTTLLMAIFLLVLLEVRRGASPRFLVLLPVCMAAWVNLHGGFLVGFIVLTMFTADAVFGSSSTPASVKAKQRAFSLVATLAACLLVSLANPAGWDIWPHTTGYLRETYLVDFTQEYMSPDFHNTLIKVFLLTLLLGTSVLALLRSRVDFLGLALWLIFTAFALHSTRNIPLFAVACMPWLATWSNVLIGQAEGRSAIIRRFENWSARIERTDSMLPGWPVAILVTGTLTLTGLDWGREGKYVFDREVFPVEAVAELRDSGFVPPGPVFNEFRWGGYLLYAWPDVRVFIDGQTDFYGEELTRQYQRIRSLAPDWRELLDSHEVEWVLVPPDAPLAAGLALTEEWRSVVADSTAVAWIRSRP